MKIIKTTFLLAFVSILLTSSVFAQTSRTNRRTTASQNSSVSNADISLGLKEALRVGVKNAVFDLGREDGFLDNAQVRIPLPDSLRKIERTLRIAGQGERVDDFVAAMNHAAEKAVPVAVDIFTDSIMQMTFNDARQILFSGEDDAATRFFRRTSEDALRREFRPIIEDFTAQTGVTQQYKRMMDRAGFMSLLVGGDAKDLDGYITDKALDGLFYMVAQEERKIRRDPVGRTTSILRKVFGILK